MALCNDVENSRPRIVTWRRMKPTDMSVERNRAPVSRRLNSEGIPTTASVMMSMPGREFQGSPSTTLLAFRIRSCTPPRQELATKRPNSSQAMRGRVCERERESELMGKNLDVCGDRQTLTWRLALRL